MSKPRKRWMISEWLRLSHQSSQHATTQEANQIELRRGSPKWNPFEWPSQWEGGRASAFILHSHSKQQWLQWGQVMTSHLYHNMFYNPFTVSLKNEGIIPFTALCTWYGLGPSRVSLTLKRLQQNSFIWKAAKVALRSDKGTPGTTTRREIRLKWIR